MTKLDIDKSAIQTLADLLHEKGLSEIEWSDGERRVRVTRQTAAIAPVAVMPAAAASTVIAPTAAPNPTPLAADDSAKHPGAVTSPMVGTAYVAAEPGAKPFVQVGDSVSAGQTLLIIEAMKTMNPIPAPRAGKVTRILVKDSSPVEFGEPLMIVE